jgi:probable rRNA maturation factor
MAALNLKFRGKKGPTNVLSFPQPDQEQSGSRPYLLGDVVICADRASDDAKELGYTDQEMILYLLVHGILHLVGYAHDQSADADRMAKRVEEIFRDLTTSKS